MSKETSILAGIAGTLTVTRLIFIMMLQSVRVATMQWTMREKETLTDGAAPLSFTGRAWCTALTMHGKKLGRVVVPEEVVMKRSNLFTERALKRRAAPGTAAFCRMAVFAVAGIGLLFAAPPQQAPGPPRRAARKLPLVIQDQGARPFGGKVLGDPAKGSLSCDHGYVEWQIPEKPRKLPILMVHASSTKTWATTFDGRDGFQNTFLRRGFSVYLTDLPRTGRAGQACKPTNYTPQLNNDQAAFTRWRLACGFPGSRRPVSILACSFP
jgi:hypothetical protein